MTALTGGIAPALAKPGDHGDPVIPIIPTEVVAPEAPPVAAEQQAPAEQPKEQPAPPKVESPPQQAPAPEIQAPDESHSARRKRRAWSRPKVDAPTK